MNLKYSSFLFILLSSIASAQNSLNFNLDTNNLLSDSEFSKIFLKVEIVGIGEVTHGDHESQVYRKFLIEKLINELNYRTICIEEFGVPVTHLNEIIHQDTIVDVQFIEKSILNLPKWIWWTTEFRDLISYLNKFNINNEKKVSIFGVDSFGNQLRDSIMAQNIIRLNKIQGKIIFLGHNYHVSHSDSMYRKYQRKWAGVYLKEKFREKYYSIGFSFNRGSFNSYVENYQLETFKVKQDNRKTAISNFCNHNKCYNKLIDIKSLDSTTKSSLDKYVITWKFTASIDPRYKITSYIEKINYLEAFDGLFVFDTITPSKNFLIPGVFYSSTKFQIRQNRLKKISKDSFTIQFNWSKDSTVKAFFSVFFISKQLNHYKIKEYFLFNNMYDSYELSNKLGYFNFTFPLEKKRKIYEIEFICYGKGKFIINDFSLIDLKFGKRLKIAYENFTFIGGNRYKIFLKSNKIIIKSLDVI